MSADRLLPFRRRAHLVAYAACVPLVVGLFVDRAQFFRSWLFAFLFWGGLGLGSLAVFLLHNLTGGGWGRPIRRAIEAGVRTLPLVALLFIPVAAGLGHLYEWSHADAVAHDAILEHKSPWLNTPFFLLRTVVYFAIWIGLGRALLRQTDRWEETGDPAVRHRRASLSAAGILLYVLTLTFAAVDWAMSLEAHWYSTIYGVHFIVGHVLGALSLALLCAARLHGKDPEAAGWTIDQLNDLGNLLLAFVMIWAYVALSQFLIIWSGNLPEETPWYIHRTGGGWQVVAVLLVAAHFAVPFVVLLARRAKRSARVLGLLAGGLLVARLVDLFWLVAPAFSPSSFRLSWLDPVAVLAVGGFWAGHFVDRLRSRPLAAPPEPAALKEAPAP